MSFTGDIKTELCRLSVQSNCCMLAECLGMLLYANQFTIQRIRLQSESAAVRKRIAQLFVQVFDIQLQRQENSLEVTDPEEIQRVYDAFGYAYKNGPLQLNRAMVEDDCCKNAFLRGAFLLGGYVSTPEKGYHLELVTPHYHIARQVSALLLDMEMPAGTVMRRGNYVLYYKDSVAIEDFLSATGATGAAMTLMLKKVERDLRNKVNRKVNCETANLSKTVEAAAKQIAAIETIKQAGTYDTLPANLKIAAEMRLQHPDLSLSELCPLFDPPLSRPGVNNRMRKLIQIAEELKQ